MSMLASTSPTTSIGRCLELASVVLAVIAAAVGPAAAGPPTDQLKQHVDEVLHIVTDPALHDKPVRRHDEIRKIAANVFDYDDTARRALGRHWNGRTPEERHEFVRLFADLLDRAYVSKVSLYQGEKVRYTGESIDEDNATVKTEIITNKGSEIPIEYRMHRKDEQWLVYDVIIDGVSLIANYRSQFNTVVQTQSFRTLVDRLRANAASAPKQ